MVCALFFVACKRGEKLLQEFIYILIKYKLFNIILIIGKTSDFVKIWGSHRKM
jgi:hypothetical protein